MMNPLVSVVVATRDRATSVVRLLQGLDRQILDAAMFEVIVVDDGSTEPVGPALDRLHLKASLRHCRIPWSGQAAARHHGASLASGDILVFVDDDMQVPADFLLAHVTHHRCVQRAVVLGRIEPDPGLERMPLFERYHARQLERWRRAADSGRTPIRGVHLCTGNVSMRRRDYVAVGGFDCSLRRSEDRELGIRLEQHGCRFVYGDDVVVIHSSDHADARVWLGRAYQYGRFDRRIARLHPEVDNAHPWRFWSLINPFSKPVVAVALVVPALAKVLSRVVFGTALAVDRLGMRGAAVTLTALSYALEYFRGLRDECGSLRALKADISPRTPGPWGQMLAGIRADHDAIRRLRQKYHGEAVSSSRLPLDLVRKVGFQMLAWYRLMRCLDAGRVPLLPLLVSRLIRHLYGAEIHWKTQIEPGVAIVHGVGLVLSHGAHVGEGCILFQNVTLGENIDFASGIVGAPRLGRNVHVGPGATLLGPIDVGEASKVAAGAVLMRSVPPASLVAAPESVVTERRHRAAPALALLRERAV